MAARRELLRQLAALDIAEKVVRIERNTQHNLAIPSAWIPDEILVMIFKTGMRPQGHSRHFGVLVSHVARRWREVALSTTELWTGIRCIVDGGMEKTERDVYYQGKDYERSVEMAREKAAVFLSRTGLAPVDIWIEGIGESSAEFLCLISGHIGHCRELRISNASHLSKGLLELLKCISSKPTPLMRSIDLDMPFDTNHEDMLPEPLFPFCAPRLTTVNLHGLDFLTMPLYLPTLGSSVTALRLTDIAIHDGEGEGYDSFRDGLMALQSLSHLEIKPVYFGSAPSRLPIVLPALQFLQADATRFRDILGPVVGCIQAASLVALSLKMWHTGGAVYRPIITDELEFHFPLLRHLDLEYVARDATDLDVLAQRFPDIERLTCQLGKNTSQLNDIGLAIGSILHGPGADEEDGGGNSNGRRRWGNLQSIAVSTSQMAFNSSRLQEMILKLQGAGHPIRKLMLPKASISQMGAEDMVKLRNIVELEDFCVDWPTPFEYAD